ncbi:alkaline phosphatase D family protein [Sphingosinicella sp.]|uniref:alkaline phosphatase D family protein n=1 Tax=Sphingosinicella sp. TaxID=1917971 RepID=UPI0035B19DA7
MTGVSRRDVMAGGVALAALPTVALAGETALSRIAFGSCAHQDKPQPIWDRVDAFDPQLFLFLGDNIYGDTRDMAVLRAKYAKLAAKPGFQRLRRKTPCLAIWDDHDYGENDAGREYPMKQASKDIFLDFWMEPKTSPRRSRAGNYTSTIIGPDGRRVQIIMPDNRWFRSGLLGITEEPKDRGPYLANSDPAATMLGAEQWDWLEAEFKKPAELRIFASSTQVLADAPGYEAWINYQADHQRLLDLIDFADVNGLIMISGDTHYAELSRLTEGVPYPLYDLTSSGLTEVWPFLGPNRLRVGEGFMGQNYGRILIDWEQRDPEIRLEVESIEGQIVLAETVRLSALQV